MAIGYNNTINGFLNTSANEIIGLLNINCQNYYVLKTQRKSWNKQIQFLKDSLTEIKRKLDEKSLDGKIFFEYDIPRMNKRVDVILLLKGIMFVLEFKNALGEEHTTNGYSVQARDQVMQYALEFSYFYSKSHSCPIIPILIDTNANDTPAWQELKDPNHNVFSLFRCNNVTSFTEIIAIATDNISKYPVLELIKSYEEWEQGDYEPTPTIIEVAEAFFNNRSVKEITRSGAGAEGIQKAIDTIEKIIYDAKEKSKKVICFLTGVPGAGKTLVGLKLVAKHSTGEKGNNEDRVFLSGNYPLVTVLQNAYINERVAEGDFVKEKNKNEDPDDITDEWKEKQKKAECKVEIEIKQKNGKVKQKKVGYYTKDYSLTLAKAKIQHVKNFRAGYDPEKLSSPHEHVFIFDEAQRAWSLEKIESEEKLNYNKSEPDILLSYLDRHNDWCVAIALVGNGQDIHDGEAGIDEWYNTLKKDDFKEWEIHVAETERSVAFYNMRSKHLTNFYDNKELYLDHPMRSFRAKDLSNFIDAILDGKKEDASSILMELQKKENGRVRFPIYLTRNISSAKEKIYEMAQGEERYGVLISSKAKRLRHYGLFAPQDDFPTVKWFLDDKRSIDSSYSMEIAASEFKIQGLEIDYALVGWDGDYKYDPESGKFLCRHFKANKWNVLKNDTPKKKKKQPSFSAECNLTEDNESDFVDNNANIRYLINTYRVLLTRARQGMVIFVPSGDMNDETVLPKEYNDTFEYLKSIGIPVIE